LTKAVLTWI